MLLNEIPVYGIIIYVGVSLTAINVALQLFLRNIIYEFIYCTSIIIGITFIFSQFLAFWYVFSGNLFFKELSVLFSFLGSTGLLFYLIFLWIKKIELFKEDRLPKKGDEPLGTGT